SATTRRPGRRGRPALDLPAVALPQDRAAADRDRLRDRVRRQEHPPDQYRLRLRRRERSSDLDDPAAARDRHGQRDADLAAIPPPATSEAREAWAHARRR